MHTEIVDLFKKYLQNRCSKEESQQVFDYIEAGRYWDEWNIAIQADEETRVDDQENPRISSTQIKNLQKRIHKRIQPKKQIRVQWKYAVAASLILAIGVSFFFMQQRPTESLEQTASIDVQPGGNKATLMLSNGQRIELNEGKKGIVISDDQVAYIDGTRLLQDAQQQSEPEEPTYATLRTPNGGQYQVTLPDGTKVWLNAASSIEYPMAFVGNERKVTVAGEAYFEVARDTSKPFKVETAGQVIEVLGTHFNVNAYTEEGMIRTTLLEGSVKVKAIKSTTSYILKPNQQSVWIKGNDKMAIANVDPTAAVGWKDGFIHFDNTDLRSVLRQLGRWYDVEVDMDRIPNKHLNGIISRNVNLSVVLEAIENTSNVRLQIERLPQGKGRRIVME